MSDQIDHAESRLSEAGLSDDLSSSSNAGSGGSNTNKWAIIGGTVGGVVLIALLIVGFFLFRRYRKRRAYGLVSKGVDMPQPAGGPGMTGGLMPLWMQRSQQNQSPVNNGNGNPAIVATPPLDSDDARLRRYSQTTLPPSNRNSFAKSRDMFNAEEREGVEPTEGDSLRIEGSKFKEEEFQSAYEGVDTGYGMGSGDMGGDRRSHM